MEPKKIAFAIDLELPLNRYYEFLQGVKDYLKKNTDYVLVNDHYPSARLAQNKIQPCYAGIIGRIRKDSYEIASELNIPVVSNWRASPVPNIPGVYADFFSAGVKIARYLLARGFTNFISFERDEKGPIIFQEGLESIFSERKIQMTKSVVDDEYNLVVDRWLEFTNHFKELVQNAKHPVAIISSNSSVAAKLLVQITEMGLKIPEEVALISTGNEYVHFKTQVPYISSIDFNFHLEGYTAAKMLDDQIKGIPLMEREILIPPGEIHTRDTTDTYAAEDEDIKAALRFINDNLNQDFQINHLAKALSISRRSLEYKFNKILGQSILDTINQIRIEFSKRMLTQTKLSIINIQREVGFTTPLQMRRVFHKYTGTTPGNYRKTHSE